MLEMAALTALVTPLGLLFALWLLFIFWRIADRLRQISENLKRIAAYLEGWPEDHEIAAMVHNVNNTYRASQGDEL